MSCRHLVEGALNRRGLDIDAAHDVTILVKGQQERAVAAIDLEHTRAGTDIERLGDVLSELVQLLVE